MNMDVQETFSHSGGDAKMGGMHTVKGDKPRACILNPRDKTACTLSCSVMSDSLRPHGL